MSNPFGMQVVTHHTWYPPWNSTTYYRGWSQNVHNFAVAEFLIEKGWFDTLSAEQQKAIYEKEQRMAYQRSIVNGGGYPD